LIFIAESSDINGVQVPDRPGDAKVMWMDEEDEELARARMDRVNKLPPTVSRTISSDILQHRMHLTAG
jgi:hypothetical protein